MNESGLPEQNPEVRRTLPEHFAHKSHLTDTAGQPWSGRDEAFSPFPTDTGERAAAVQRALEQVDAGADASYENLVAALQGTRVLIPIQAIATDTAVTASGHHADNASDMAMVKLQLSETDVTLPIFTDVASLSAWNPEARPVPLVLEQAAQAGVSEGCTMLVVDLGRDGTITLSRSALWAIAQGRTWTAPYRDPAVLEVMDQIPSIVAGVRTVAMVPGQSREVDLQLHLVPGLDREQVQGIVAQVQGYLAHSEVVAERVSSLKLSLR